MFTTLTALFLTLASASVLDPRDSIAIPPECDVIPAWQVTNFLWFNSSHNLDCVSEVDVRMLSPTHHTQAPS